MRNQRNKINKHLFILYKYFYSLLLDCGFNRKLQAIRPVKISLIWASKIHFIFINLGPNFFQTIMQMKIFLKTITAFCIILCIIFMWHGIIFQAIVSSYKEHHFGEDNQTSSLWKLLIDTSNSNEKRSHQNLQTVLGVSVL
jgi:hypothetical protein